MNGDYTITVSNGAKEAKMVLSNLEVEKVVRKAPGPDTQEWDDSIREFGEVKSAIGMIVTDAIKAIHTGF